MQKIIITNQIGGSITLGNQAPYFLETIDGAAEVAVFIEKQKAPNQDGSSYICNTFEERDLTIEGTIITRGSSTDISKARRKMQEVLNPKLGEVTITYYFRDIVREIKGIAEATPSFPSKKGNRGLSYQKYLIHLICHQPFWLETYYESKEMSYIIGGLKFKSIFPTAFSSRGFQRKAVNSGDVSTPVTIEIKGPAINPTITNETTGEFLKINRELQESDVLNISTAFGEKQVKVNGSNAFHYIDINSTYWQLIPGDNILSYTSNNDSITTKVLVKWKNRYIGI
jgi:hypothetical protein